MRNSDVPSRVTSRHFGVHEMPAGIESRERGWTELNPAVGTAIERGLSLLLEGLVVAGFVVARRIVNRFELWLYRHTSHTERQLLHIIGEEAACHVAAATGEPADRQLGQALNYVREILTRKQLVFSEAEVLAAVERATQCCRVKLPVSEEKAQP